MVKIVNYLEVAKMRMHEWEINYWLGKFAQFGIEHYTQYPDSGDLWIKLKRPVKCDVITCGEETALVVSILRASAENPHDRYSFARCKKCTLAVKDLYED